MATSPSRVSPRRAAWIATSVACIAFAPACSRHASEPAPKQVPQATQATEVAAPAPSASAAVVHGTRKQRNLDVPVFVDGAQVAVLRYGELPTQLALATNPINDTQGKRFYRLGEYLKAIGVDVDHAKSIHFMGTHSRISQLEGSELRAQKDRFVFDFQSGETGIAKIDWDTTALKDLTRIDEIYAVNVFVKDAPRAVDPSMHCYLDDVKECVPVARLSSGDLAKGTRVYVDGRMVSFVKRRLIADSVGAGDNAAGEKTFSVDKYLTSLGIDASHAKGVELLSGDDVIARADGAAWTKDRDAIVFTLPKHSHGKVRAIVPADLQGRAQSETAKDRDVTLTSIKIYRTTNPSSRTLTAIDEVIDQGAIPSADDSNKEALAGGSGHERDEK